MKQSFLPLISILFLIVVDLVNGAITAHPHPSETVVTVTRRDNSKGGVDESKLPSSSNSGHKYDAMNNNDGKGVVVRVSGGGGGTSGGDGEKPGNAHGIPETRSGPGSSLSGMIVTEQKREESQLTSVPAASTTSSSGSSSNGPSGVGEQQQLVQSQLLFPWTSGVAPAGTNTFAFNSLLPANNNNLQGYTYFPYQYTSFQHPSYSSNSLLPNGETNKGNNQPQPQQNHQQPGLVLGSTAGGSNSLQQQPQQNPLLAASLSDQKLLPAWTQFIAALHDQQQRQAATSGGVGKKNGPMENPSSSSSSINNPFLQLLQQQQQPAGATMGGSNPGVSLPVLLYSAALPPGTVLVSSGITSQALEQQQQQQKHSIQGQTEKLAGEGTGSTGRNGAGERIKMDGGATSSSSASSMGNNGSGGAENEKLSSSGASTSGTEGSKKAIARNGDGGAAGNGGGQQPQQRVQRQLAGMLPGTLGAGGLGTGLGVGGVYPGTVGGLGAFGMPGYGGLGGLGGMMGGGGIPGQPCQVFMTTNPLQPPLPITGITILGGGCQSGVGIFTPNFFGGGGCHFAASGALAAVQSPPIPGCVIQTGMMGGLGGVGGTYPYSPFGVTGLGGVGTNPLLGVGTGLGGIGGTTFPGMLGMGVGKKKK